MFHAKDQPRIVAPAPTRGPFTVGCDPIPGDNGSVTLGASRSSGCNVGVLPDGGIAPKLLAASVDIHAAAKNRRWLAAHVHQLHTIRKRNRDRAVARAVID